MTLDIGYQFGPSSIVNVLAYASTTANAYFAFEPRAQRPLGFKFECGSIYNAGHVAWTLDHSMDNPNDTSPTWNQILTGTTLSASGAATQAFENTSATGALMPYGRLQFIAKNGGSTNEFTVQGLVGKILTEMK